MPSYDPPGVESNHFAYHLDQLLKSGLITKQDRKYVLSAEGLAYADRASHHDTDIRKQPHIVTTIHISNEAGDTALSKHTFQPYIGLIGLPQGRMHYGEYVQQAAERELLEKTGLANVPLTLRGTVYVRCTKEDTAISAILSHVFSGTVAGKPQLNTANPQKTAPLWEQVPTKIQSGYMPGFWEIMQLLHTHPTDELFFAEVDATL